MTEGASNEELVRLMEAGDPRGVDGLFTTWGPLVARRLARRWRLASDDDLVQSATTDTVLAVAHQFQATPGQIEPAKLEGYLWTCATRAFFRLRTERRVEQALDPGLLDLRAAPAGGEGRADELDRFVEERLSEMEHAVFRADLADGVKANGQELADELGTTVDTVYQARRRYLRKLETWLDAASDGAKVLGGGSRES